MNPDKELTAMTAIAAALDTFEESEHETLARVVRWAASRYKVSVGEHPTGRGAGGTESKRGLRDQDNGEASPFEDIADLYDATRPTTEAEKALVGGYWMMQGEGKQEFTGMEVNARLKNLGHGVSNITDALSQLMGRKPALVMQTAKSGKSRQARKKYKLTRAGLDSIVGSIGGDPNKSES